MERAKSRNGMAQMAEGAPGSDEAMGLPAIGSAAEMEMDRRWI
jgi:hypothetical protein